MSRKERSLQVVSLSIAIVAIILAIYTVSVLTNTVKELKSYISTLQSDVEKLRKIVLPFGKCPEVKYAKLFKIYCDGVAKIVKDALNRTILVMPRNISRDIVQYYVNKYKPDVVVEVPVQRIILGSSTQVALVWRLDKEFGLHLFQYIIGIMWGRKYTWYIPEVKELLENGTVVDVGYIDEPDYEKILTLKPDLVIIYTIPGYEPSAKLLEKLNELNIPYVVDNEWMENTVLGRFEWIKFIALFLGIEDRAINLFNKVEKEVKEIQNRLRKVEEIPNIAWFLIYRGIIWAPRPGSYVHNLIEICRGKYLYENYTKIDLELVLSLANKTDVLVYSSYFINSINDILKEEPRLKELKAIKLGNVYAYKPEIWQIGYAYTEDLVKDVCSIIHPEIFKEHELKFFKKLK